MNPQLEAQINHATFDRAYKKGKSTGHWNVILLFIAFGAIGYAGSYITGAQDIVATNVLINGELVECAHPQPTVWVCQPDTGLTIFEVTK